LKNHTLLELFAKLDDNDVVASIKVWAEDEDPILSRLSNNLLNRKLYKVEMGSTAASAQYKNSLMVAACKKYKIKTSEANYFVFSGTVNNSAYDEKSLNINVLMNDGSLVDVANASDLLNLKSLSKTVSKHYLCYPKDLRP